MAEIQVQARTHLDTITTARETSCRGCTVSYGTKWHLPASSGVTSTAQHYRLRHPWLDEESANTEWKENVRDSSEQQRKSYNDKKDVELTPDDTIVPYSQAQAQSKIQ